MSQPPCSYQPTEEPEIEDEFTSSQCETDNPASKAQLSKPGRCKSKKATKKPLGILAYNRRKAGIDLSDQMASYVSTLRKGIKWYRKLGLELLLGAAVVNAWLLYKHVTKKIA